MRRGFKTEAKSLALELRAEIGLDAHAPFDPYTFASEYGIPVVQLSDLDGGARDHFLRADGSALSGALIPNGSGGWMKRQASSTVCRPSSRALGSNL